MFAVSGKNYFWQAWLFTLTVLISTGLIYRHAKANESVIEKQVLTGTIPLKEFPKKINKWIGKDASTDYPVKQATGSNDYLLGIYENEDRKWVHLYITFCAQPRNMLGHRPEICFTASGWKMLNKTEYKFATASQKIIPCIKYRFEKPFWPKEEMSVLNFYIFNGQLTSNHKDFSGIKWRTLTNPNKKVRYIAQIQISSPEEYSGLLAAKEMTDLILDFFPKAEN